jgi:hypothetical protein
MRTTLPIVDGLLRQLRQKALDSGKPFKQLVNETLRAGLHQPLKSPRELYRCPTFSIGAHSPGVDLSKATLLAAQLDDDALIDKLRQGR